jgi:GNAT superfamily N-acetyltransferase
MSQVEKDVVRRCHANSVESYRAFAGGITGARVRERSELFACDTGDTNPLGNVAWILGPPTDVGRTLREIRDFFAVSGVPWILLALPEVSEVVKGAARDQGFRREGVYPGMLLDPIPTRVEESGGLDVRPVRSEPELRAFDTVEARAYGVGQVTSEAKLLTVPNITMFVGYLDHVPKSVAALVVSEKMAGIVAVGTLPEARGRGFAQRVVGKALEVGRDLGCERSFLWATARGRHVYAKMGFQKIFDYPVWSPPGSQLPPEDLPVAEG